MNGNFVDLNLLPRRTAPAQREPLWRRLVMPGFGLLALAFLLVFVSGLLMARNSRILARQEQELQARGDQVSAFVNLAREVEILQQQVTTLAQQTQQLEADAERVQRQNAPVAPLLSALSEALPAGMKLTGVVQDANGNFLVQGEASSSPLFFQYVNDLKERPGVGIVTPQSVEQLGADASAGAVRWTLLVAR